MILSFRSRPLQRYWDKNDPRGLNPQHVPKLKRILIALAEAKSAEDMNLPLYRFHKLTGEDPDRWSVHVNANWRVTFAFDGQDAIQVDYEDYH